MPVDQLHGSPLSKSLPALHFGQPAERAEHRKRHVTFSTAYPRVPQGGLDLIAEGSEGGRVSRNPGRLTWGSSRPLLPWSGNRSTEPVDMSVNNLPARNAEPAQLLHSRRFA
jgi:hypothetical protein